VSAVKREKTMSRIILAVAIAAFAISSAAAQSCESKAVSAEGKPLSGAAKIELREEVQAGCLPRQGGERRRQAAVRCSQE
jgi:hypothetical protein